MSAPQGGRFIAPDPAEIARILARHRFLKPITQPAGAYPGQSGPVPSVGSWSFVMARPGLDDAVATRLARALHQAEAAPSPQLAETTAKNTLAALPDPSLLNPAVRTYYRQIGLVR
jgi:TRAP-type uncharacterized transport system substrate-binding protein